MTRLGVSANPFGWEAHGATASVTFLLANGRTGASNGVFKQSRAARTEVRIGRFWPFASFRGRVAIGSEKRTSDIGQRRLAESRMTQCGHR
jgi:hypothetical protein